MSSDAQDNPDRSGQYKIEGAEIVNVRTGSRYSVVDQLDENFRQLRLVRSAVQDRDRVIAELHESIHRRDDVIGAQAKTIKLFNRVRPLVYAMIGGALAELGHWAMLSVLHVR